MAKILLAILKSLLKALAWLIGSAFVVFVVVGGWTRYADARADRLATTFCAAVKPGDDFDALVARVTRAGTPGRVVTGDREMMFTYHGGLTHLGVCRVTFVGGKVASAKFRTIDN